MSTFFKTHTYRKNKHMTQRDELLFQDEASDGKDN